MYRFPFVFLALLLVSTVGCGEFVTETRTQDEHSVDFDESIHYAPTTVLTFENETALEAYLAEITHQEDIEIVSISDQSITLRYITSQ